jgi:hypothetical protein
MALETAGQDGEGRRSVSEREPRLPAGSWDDDDERRLEAEVRLEILGDLAHEPLERQLADEELG